MGSRAFQIPRFDLNNMRLDQGSQVRGRGKTVFDPGKLSMPACLAASPARARYHLLPSLTRSVGVHNIEYFDPAHLTLWRIRPCLSREEPWALMRTGGFAGRALLGLERIANRTCLRVPGGCTSVSVDVLQGWKKGLTETTAG